METQTEFQIPFRTVRIGSLKTYPPKGAKNCKLRFSKDELKFRVVVDQKDAQQDAMKIVIPTSGIALLEAHLMRGCPVIWVTPDVSNARKIRRICGMQMTSHPSPYLDPKSKELADRRLSIIPADDPINQHELSKFRTIVRIIAAERNIPVEKFFVELTRIDCNEQLVMCTRYISQLTKFQSTFRMKQELVTETRSAVLDVKTEETSPVTSKASAIVISSDEDDDAKRRAKKKRIAKKPAEALAEPSLSSSSGDELPTFSVNSASSQKEAEQPKRGASPDLFDFSDDDDNPPSAVESKKQRIDAWVDDQSQNRPTANGAHSKSPTVSDSKSRVSDDTASMSDSSKKSKRTRATSLRQFRFLQR